jgi:hypothetical protein
VRTSDNLDRTARNDFSITTGTFELGAPGFLTCNLTVGGDWVRSSSGAFFVPNQNKVTFNSTLNAVTQLQTITVSGVGGNETFYDLEENNSLGLTLSGTTKAYVTNHLYLTSGLINTGTNEVYVMNNSSTAISGDQTNQTLAAYLSSAHVNGNLRRNVIVSTDYDFPVGTSTNYQLASMKFSNIASITNVLASFTSGTSGTFTGCTINTTTIVGMLDGGYWTMTPTGATAGAIYDLTLYETGYSNSVASSNYIGIIKRSNSGLPWSGTNAAGSDGFHVNSTQVLYSGPVAKAVRTNIPTFSDYAIGYSNNIVLPIELTTFAVTPSNNDAVLSWNTSSEYNSDFFAIERSLDGISFTEIGKVEAAGTSISPLDYSFVDYGVNEFSVNKIYYRLRMVDADASFDYSEVRWISTVSAQNEPALVVFPNPFIDQVSVGWNSSDDGRVVLELSDASGKIISHQDVECIRGNNFILLDQYASLAKGVYFLRFICGRTQLTQKLVKQ